MRLPKKNMFFFLSMEILQVRRCITSPIDVAVSPLNYSIISVAFADQPRLLISTSAAPVLRPRDLMVH